MSFLKYSLQTGFVRVFLLFVSMANGIINARWLKLEGVGILALLSIVQITAFRFGNLGFGSAFAFFVARKKAAADRVLKLVWPIGLSLSCVTCLLLLAVWQYKASPWHDIMPGLFYLTLPTVPMYYIRNYLQRILSSQLRITVINVSEIIGTVTLVLFTVFYVVYLDLAIYGAVWAFVISQYVVVLFLVTHLLWSKRNLQASNDSHDQERTRIIELWRYGRWNYLVMLANFLFDELPLFFLKYFGSNQVVGLFHYARNLSRKPRLMVQPFSTMLFPFTAASDSKHAAERTNMLCRNFLLVMLFLMIILGVIAKPLIVLLYGSSFLPVASVFYAIMPVVILYPLTQFLGVHVAADGNPKLVFLTSLISLAVALVFCLTIVPRYGAVGAGLAVSAAYIALMISRLAAYIRHTGSKLSHVVLFQKSDLYLYHSVLAKVASRIRRKGSQ